MMVSRVQGLFFVLDKWFGKSEKHSLYFGYIKDKNHLQEELRMLVPYKN